MAAKLLVLSLAIMTPAGALVACGAERPMSRGASRSASHLPLASASASPPEEPLSAESETEGPTPPPADASIARPRRVLHREYVYEGTVAGKPATVRFRCDEKTPCSGYYFYTSVGAAIPLVADGASGTVFVESVRTMTTGRLNLDATPGENRIGGKWSSPDAKSTATISLTLVPRGAPRVFVRTIEDHAKDDGRCKEAITTLEIAGLASAEIEQSINDMLDPEVLGVLINPHVLSYRMDLCKEGELGTRCTTSALGRQIRCVEKQIELQYEATTKIESTYVDPDVLSMKFTTRGWSGGNHPFDSSGAINIDLRTGAFVGPDAWLTQEAAPIDWTTFEDPAVLPKGTPLSIASPDGAPNVLDDYRAMAGDPLRGWSQGYATRSALALIPDVPEVDRGLRGSVTMIPWQTIAKLVRHDGPMAKLLSR